VTDSQRSGSGRERRNDQLARFSKLRTPLSCHGPPRAVRTPRSFNAVAIARDVSAPAACISRTMGSTLAANLAALALFAAWPRARVSASLGLPSFLPSNANLSLTTASAAFVRALMASRSCSATAASIWIVSLLACGMSAAMTPESISVEMNATLRLSRSSLAMTSLALCFLQAAMAAASCGRLSLFAGGGEAWRVLLGHTVQLSVGALAPAHPHLKAGTIVALATTGGMRWHDLPEVSTMAEAGFKDFLLETYVGLMAPAMTPPEIVARLERDTLASLNRPDIRDKLAQSGFQVEAKDGKSHMARIAREVPMFRELISQAGIKKL
jgi:hypothetical protein